MYGLGTKRRTNQPLETRNHPKPSCPHCYWLYQRHKHRIPLPRDSNLSNKDTHLTTLFHLQTESSTPGSPILSPDTTNPQQTAPPEITISLRQERFHRHRPIHNHRRYHKPKLQTIPHHSGSTTHRLSMPKETPKQTSTTYKQFRIDPP